MKKKQLPKKEDSNSTWYEKYTESCLLYFILTTHSKTHTTHEMHRFSSPNKLYIEVDSFVSLTCIFEQIWIYLHFQKSFFKKKNLHSLFATCIFPWHKQCARVHDLQNKKSLSQSFLKIQTQVFKTTIVEFNARHIFLFFSWKSE